MSCDIYHDLLGDYVDGARASTRPGDERLAAFERHLPACADCQALVADFTSIRRTASMLEEHVPPPRLWTKIAASIEEERRRRWWQRPLADAFPGWLPIAVAVSVAIVIAGFTWFAWNTAPPEVVQQASAPAETLPVAAEAHYDEAIAGLQRLAESQDGSLDPGTRAVLKENLAVLDRAISESRAALADEPANTLAQESLLDALDTKVALLQDTVALATDEGTLADDAAAPQRN